MKMHIGGSFAPPLTDAKLDEYELLIEALSISPLKDGLMALLKCCRSWWALPESKAAECWQHESGKGIVIPLELAHQKSLWNEIPWTHEIQAIEVLSDKIDPIAQKDLRDAAFHLLWHVKELDLDREPMTADKL